MRTKSIKTNFIFISLKDNSLSIIFILFLIGLILFSRQNLIAAKDGLNLWVQGIVPSLLPFFIACELLSFTNLVDFLGMHLKKFMKPLFNVPGEGAFPFILGIISGYPVRCKNCYFS